MTVPIPSVRAVVVGAIMMSVLQPAGAELSGDPERGRAVFLDRELGHCVLCHRVAQLDVPFQGNLGPELSDVADRVAIDEIRARVADPTVINPQTAMPAYHRTTDLIQVAQGYEGRPVLDAQQLEDLIAFLATLRRAGAATEPGQ